jgi:hypothetical protein
VPGFFFGECRGGWRLCAQGFLVVMDDRHHCSDLVIPRVVAESIPEPKA